MMRLLVFLILLGFLSAIVGAWFHYETVIGLGLLLAYTCGSGLGVITDWFKDAQSPRGIPPIDMQGDC